MYSDIGDSSANVQNVAYVLPAPVGVTVVSVSYPPDTDPTIHETFQSFADGKAHKYYNTATVTDATSRVAVTTYSLATAPSGKVKSATISGIANQTLEMTLSVK